MSTTVQVPKIAAVKPSKPAAKEKKAKAPTVTKPKSVKNASHPPYFEMIKDALLALKEKGGSSPYAIGKYIEEKQKTALPANFRKMLGLQLKNSASNGKLIKVKASYKLSDSSKKEKAPNVMIAKKKVEKAKKIVAAKATKKAVTPVKKPVKAKAKQPKSIKSPAAKKAKKVAA